MSEVVVAMPPTIQERYEHFKKNAEMFVETMNIMVAAAVRDGDDQLAAKLQVWCVNPWKAALRDDASGDLWPTCEVCSLPIKNDRDHIASDDGCAFHRACVGD